MVLSTFMRVVLGIVVWLLLFYFSYSLSCSLADHKSRKNDTADIAIFALFFLLALAASVALCVEMLINNPYNGIYTQVCVNAFLYTAACALGFSDHDESRVLCSISSVLCFISIVTFLVTLMPVSFFSSHIPAEFAEYDGKEFTVEHEVTESHNVLSANDAYEVEGCGFICVFAIDTYGRYRYYYRGEDGAIEPGSIDTFKGDKLFDDCEEDGAPPRIERVRSYKGHYVVHNKQIKKKIETESLKIWDELHVPKGSIDYSFTFDLQ